MKRNIRTVFYSLFLVITACSKQESPLLESGCFALERLELSCEEEIIPLTRAVDDQLCIQLWQHDELIKEYAPGSDLSERVILPVGAYVLKAFTLEDAEAPSEEFGLPVYRLEQGFVIEQNNLTALSLVVPRVNMGVFVRYDASVAENFRDITLCVLSSSGRKITISGTDDERMRYFDLPADGKLKYTFTVTNADDEIFSVDKELVNLVPKNYQLVVDID